jgi:hypothetical protein
MGSTPRERNDMYPVRSRQVSTTGHTRSRTEQIPPGHHSQERRRGER